MSRESIATVWKLEFFYWFGRKIRLALKIDKNKEAFYQISFGKKVVEKF